MRILQTDDSTACDQVADGLRRAGHDVLAECLPDRSAQHECLGLHNGNCPIDEGIDLAIAGVDHVQEVASAGVVCSRRHSVPVVTVGRHDVNHPDLSNTLGRMARRGDEFILWSVEQALQGTLEQMGLPQGSVELDRDAACERIVARVPHPMSDPERSQLAVRLLAAATATGRVSRRRDVLVQTV